VTGGWLDGLRDALLSDSQVGLVSPLTNYAGTQASLISRGEYILPRDADNRLRSGYFEHGIRILDSNSQIGVVYGDAEYIGMRTGRWHVGSFDRDLLLQWNHIDACAIYRRSFGSKVGDMLAPCPFKDGKIGISGSAPWSTARNLRMCLRFFSTIECPNNR
jgi:hypothetical protein